MTLASSEVNPERTVQDLTNEVLDSENYIFRIVIYTRHLVLRKLKTMEHVTQEDMLDFDWKDSYKENTLE
jgi:hypothetical protein